MEYIIKHFCEVEPAEPSTRTSRQKACEKLNHIHNPTEEKIVVIRLPTKMESIQPGTSRLSADRKPSTTYKKLQRGPKLKVQNHNFIKKREETRHTKSVRFQEGNKIHHFLPHRPLSKRKGSTRKNRIASGGSAKLSCTEQQQ
jgi:hypothetical protein